MAKQDRHYRGLDRLLDHKQDLLVWLKCADLFAADFEVLFYDLTSTCFEGEMENNPKAKRGYSRDGRPDCLPLRIALVITITTDGFPQASSIPAWPYLDSLRAALGTGPVGTDACGLGAFVAQFISTEIGGKAPATGALMRNLFPSGWTANSAPAGNGAWNRGRGVPG